MIKKQMQGGDPAYRTSAGQHLLAAAEASTITALMTNPIWVVKTRIFATPKNDPHAYSGLWSESSSLVRRHAELSRWAAGPQARELGPQAGAGIGAGTLARTHARAPRR